MDKTNHGKITSGNHLSYWINSVPAIEYTSLNKNINTEVVIVGAGISGISLAYNLLKSGRKVVVVEDGFVGSGETGRTTAHAVNALDDRYYKIEDEFGLKKTKLIAQSHTRAIEFIEQTCLKENIDCDFARIPGYLFLHNSGTTESLLEEFEAAKRAGIKVEKLDYVPGTNKKIPCLKFPAQAQFHPLKYLKGLCNAIEKMGGQIFTSTHAAKIDHKGIETTEGFKVEAEHVVVATNSPVNNKHVINLKQSPFRTYVIGAKVKKKQFTSGIVVGHW